MVELSWSVEIKILGTISFSWNVLIIISSRRIIFRFQKNGLYKNGLTLFHGSQNLKFYWPTQFNHLVTTQPNVGSIWNIDGSIAERLNFNKKQIWSSFDQWVTRTIRPNITDSKDQFKAKENWPELFHWRWPHLFIVPDSFFPDHWTNGTFFDKICNLPQPDKLS